MHTFEIDVLGIEHTVLPFSELLIGAYLAFYNQERPHQALGYRSPGQVFHAVSPQRCLLEHPQALQSDEGLRDTPAVDSLILAKRR